MTTPADVRVDKVRLAVAPELDWQLPAPPDTVWEVWIDRAQGRHLAEFVGWLGERRVGWELHLAPGLPGERVQWGASEMDVIATLLEALEAA